MKKLISALLTIATCFFVFATLSACGVGGDPCANGHTSGQFVSSVNPTCEQGGYIVYHCSACDKEYFEPDGSEPLGHYVYNYTYDNNHTCTTNGTQSGLCNRCGKTASKEVPNTKKHEWENSIYCKHCNTEEYQTRNLQFTLNQDQTGYIVSWKTYTAEEVVQMLQNQTTYSTWETILNIPATYNNLPVVEIAENAFNGELYAQYDPSSNWESTLSAAGYDNHSTLWNVYNSTSGINFVNIPSSVKTVNQYAFYRMKFFAGEKCTYVLNEGLEHIGFGAFSDCGAKGTITLPSTLTFIAESAFSGCTFLDEVIFNCNKITTIPRAMFSTAGLRKVTIPSNITKIESYAFDCFQLLTIIIESDNLVVDNNAFSYTTNTVINKSNHDYTLEEIDSWFYGTNENFAIRDFDPNRSITTTCIVQDNNYVNGVHVGVALFEREITFYYSHLNGENILTNVVRPLGTLKELTIPEGITVIGEGLLSSIYCDLVTLPSSLKKVDYSYGFSPQKLIASEYTNLTALNISSSTTVTLTESENVVNVNVYDIWNSLNTDNQFSYTQEGVTFKFSVPGKAEMSTNEGEVISSENPSVWFYNNGLKVELSLANGDDRQAIYLGILGNNASGSINNGVKVYAYYFDNQDNDYKKVTTSYYQFDVDNDEFSWVENQIENNYGNGDWFFSLENIEGFGYKVKTISIKFAQNYDIELNKI